MTEQYVIEDGRLQVERVEGKSNVDVDLDKVESWHYERGVRSDTAGALVLKLKDRVEPVVVRVDAGDDAAAVVETLRGHFHSRAKDDEAKEEAPREDPSAVETAEEVPPAANRASRRTK